MNAMYGTFVLPESLPKDRRAPFSWKRANPVGALKVLAGHRELFGLAGVIFLSYLAHEVLPSTFVLYAGYRYGWSVATVGHAGHGRHLLRRGAGVASWGRWRRLASGRRSHRLFWGAAGFAIYAWRRRDTSSGSHSGHGHMAWRVRPCRADTKWVGPSEQGRSRARSPACAASAA
jgi:DHA1 family tetracycline resistance protein-like MFS transporter